MTKNLILLMAVITLAFSCKKEDATAKIDASTEAIPPASADAVILDNPTVQAPETQPVAKPEPPADGKYPKMSFAKTEHDFGSIKEGDKPDYTFTFVNNGEADLLIKEAKGSCGCTVPEYPKEPIKPGATGKIKVSFNSAGKPGQQHKTVTITTNTKSGQEKLDIKATVTPKEAT